MRKNKLIHQSVIVILSAEAIFFSLVFFLFVHIVNELPRVYTLNNGASLCTWIVSDTKPPEGSVGVSCGWSQRQKVGNNIKIFW